MRHVERLATAVGLVGLAVLTCLGAPRICYAQSVAGPSADPGAASDDASTKKGLMQVINGSKAYKAGKMDSAVSTLSAAISSGGLSSKDLAKALYFRGLAYRRSQKPAEAIADLTSAIWLKDGLSDAERGEALKNRSAAYKEAGINEPETSVAAAQSSGPPAGAGLAPDTTSTGATSGSWQTATQSTSTAQAASATKITPTSNSISPATTIVPMGAPAEVTQPSLAANAEPSTSTGIGNPLSGVGTFLSSMFGGGSATSQVTTGTTGNAATASSESVLSSPSAGAVSAVSGWSSETKVAAGTPAKPEVATKVARTTIGPKTKVKAKAPAGRFQVRLAAVRSQDEAQNIATTFEQKHASALDGRKPKITSQAFGNMGTFYNVQVGPFAREKDFAPLCIAAQAGGYDCLVVKN